MGQKVHPYGFRLGYNKTWKSRWYEKKSFGKLLNEDLKIKKALKMRFYRSGISRIEIERAADKLRVFIYAARPGILIGKKGKDIEKLRSELSQTTGRDVDIKAIEVKNPEIDAQLVGEGICLQLEKRIAFRRAMKRAVDTALKNGAKGVKIRCSGRLNGVEIARSEWYLMGQLPLHTLKADIDYGFAQAYTTYGVIGVKVWIYKGELLKKDRLKAVEQ
ncbi:MAG: 30S ribosomal protein S3 [Acidobacteria bacterium]|nr:30S ribosomal protein S3 [Acidobacteriota bacterium]